MIRIMPVNDEIKVKVLFEKYGVPLPESPGAFAVMDGDESSDCCLYSISGGTAALLYLSASEIWAADGLCRALMNSLTYKDIVTLEVGDMVDKGRMLELGYIRPESGSISVPYVLAKKC